MGWSFFKKKNDQAHFAQRINTALQLVEWGDLYAAERLLEDCVAQNINAPLLHFHLGEIRRRRNHMDEAIKSYQAYIALDSRDTMGAAIKLALMGERPMPRTLPSEYLQHLFDQYAPSFEKCLVEQLNYAAPAQIADAVFTVTDNRFQRVLDLGCGTGLSGAPFRDRAEKIDGVDLSRGMLEIANEKEIYDELHTAEISGFLRKTKELYDLILCADVLIYIGAAEELFKLVSAILSENGLFAFSIQKAWHGDFILGEDHRYSHSSDYIRHCVENAGMEVLSCNAVILRKEGNTPVEGEVYVCANKKRP